MRDIKFRAWDKERKIMESCISINPFHINDCDRRTWKRNEVKVMQYTGLKDKNGVGIYEGDIIHTEGEYPGEGWYDTGEHYYDFNGVVTWEQEDLALKCEGYYLNELDCIKVIGNIFENPELLLKED